MALSSYGTAAHAKETDTSRLLGAARVALGACCVALGLAACTTPSGNIGEPVAPNSWAITLNTRFVTSCADTRFVDPTQGEIARRVAGEEPVICDEPARSFGAVLPASVGIRRGGTEYFDLGANAGWSSAGLDTRIRVFGSPDTWAGVVTFDARKGYSSQRVFDLHSRALVFAPLGPLRGVLGGGLAYGTFNHFVMTALETGPDTPPHFDLIERQETSLDAVVGIGPKNGLIYAYANPYWVTSSEPFAALEASNLISYRQQAVLIVGLAMTLPINTPKSPQ